MSFQCDLYITKSEKTALDKTMETGGTSLSGTLINNSNVVNPSVLCHVSAETVAGYNYMKIPSFNRHYFITEITALTHDTCLVQGHVDVLSTYKDEIRNNGGIIGRQENKWNLYLDDNMIKVDARTQITTSNQFKTGGNFTDNPSICLVVVQ